MQMVPTHHPQCLAALQGAEHRGWGEPSFPCCSPDNPECYHYLRAIINTHASDLCFSLNVKTVSEVCFATLEKSSLLLSLKTVNLKLQMCACLCVYDRKVDGIFLIYRVVVRDPCFYLIFPWLIKGCGTSHFPFSSLNL